MNYVLSNPNYPHHYTAVLSHCWVKASACCFHVCLYCAVLSVRSDGTLPVVIWFVSSQSCQSFSRYFRFIGFPDGDMRCTLVLSYFADEPCQSPLPSYYLFNHVKYVYLFYFPDVYFLSRYVMFIFVCAGANGFMLHNIIASHTCFGGHMDVNC